MGEFVLAIDIGGSLTKFGLVTRDGEVFKKKVFRTEAQLPFSDFIKRLKKGLMN